MRGELTLERDAQERLGEAHRSWPWTVKRMRVPCSPVGSSTMRAWIGRGPSSMRSAKTRSGSNSETSTSEASFLPPGPRWTSRRRVPTPSGPSPSWTAETVFVCQVGSFAGSVT